MKQIYTLLTIASALSFAMSSCSTSKNTTQSQSTDDMYYSSGTAKKSGSAQQGDYYSATPNDQYVQMRVQDPERWSYFDNYNAYDSYYSPSAFNVGYSAGFGYPYPAYGFGYGYGFGPSIGFGFGDPYMMWNSYFIWNSWYNPYFYNPYYGGGAIVVGHSATSVYSSLRPFNSTAYANGLAHNTIHGAPRSTLYRPGMTSTSAYNSNIRTTRAISSYRTTNSYRPVNNNNSFRTFQPTRSYTPSVGGGGGFRGGGGIRH